MSGMYYPLAQLVAPAVPSTLSNVMSGTIKETMRIFWRRCSLHSSFNCFKSLHSPQQAKDLLDRMSALLTKSGFEIRQWASNKMELISHLPANARSTTCEKGPTLESPPLVCAGTACQTHRCCIADIYIYFSMYSIHKMDKMTVSPI